MPLLSYEEYKKLGRHNIPYLLKISRGEKHLFFFGEDHSYDLNHSQWDVLKNFWQEFLNSTESKKRIVLTEGGVREALPTEEESITKNGGMGLVSFLAKEAGIKIDSPEPNGAQERIELEKSFSRDEIQYYYFARVVAQYGIMNNPKPIFKKYIESHLRQDKKESKWDDYDFSLNHMVNVHKELFGKEFNFGDREHFYNVSNPTVLTTTTNKISRAVSDIRDKHIVKEIQKYWEGGVSIFASYGCTHVVMQEPLLKEVLK